MPNAWLTHIKKTMRKMKDSGKYVAGKGLKQVIMAAKKTWHHAKKSVGLKGGADGEDSDSDKEDGKMRDVNLMGDAAAKEARRRSSGSTGMEVDADSLANVTGGRKRKTRRRRHSRRR
jgi:hypothetical protein